MSVKITNFETWEYQHDDAPGGSHGGTLDPATVTYGTNIDGSDNLHVIAVPCPFEGCGSVSYWPPGGGADALLGQSLHVVMAYSQPSLAARGGTPQDAAAEVKQRVIDTDGEERWVLDEAAVEVLKAAALR
jgi:hypothetical protein